MTTLIMTTKLNDIDPSARLADACDPMQIRKASTRPHYTNPQIECKRDIA